MPTPSLREMFELRLEPLTSTPDKYATGGRTPERLRLEHELWRAIGCIKTDDGGPRFSTMCLQDISEYDYHNPFVTVANKLHRESPTVNAFKTSGSVCPWPIDPEPMPVGEDPAYWQFRYEHKLARAHFISAEWITAHMFYDRGSHATAKGLVERLVCTLEFESNNIDQAALALLQHLESDPDLTARIRARHQEDLKAVDAKKLPTKPVLEEFPTHTHEWEDMYSHRYACTLGGKSAQQRLFEAKTFEVLRWMVGEGMGCTEPYHGRDVDNTITVQCAIAPAKFDDLSPDERRAAGMVSLSHIAIDLEDGRVEDAMVGAFLAAEGLNQVRIKLSDALACLTWSDPDATTELENLSVERSWPLPEEPARPNKLRRC